jgi:hypothetical protein
MELAKFVSLSLREGFVMLTPRPLTPARGNRARIHEDVPKTFYNLTFLQHATCAVLNMSCTCAYGQISTKAKHPAHKGTERHITAPY